MSDYHIEKIRRSVAVFLQGGRRLDGDVFLQPSVRYRLGPQAPLELLNDEDAFLPVSSSDDQLILVAKGHIVRVEAAREDADTDLVQHAPQVPLELLLSDGSTIHGVVHPELRAARPRLLDYLNACEGRFLLVSAGASTMLINRACIVHARERA